MLPIVTLTMNPALDITTRTTRMSPGEKLRCSAPRHDPGGGGINVARAFRTLGGSAIAVFPVGGATGQWVETLLKNENVPHSAIPIAGTTRENFTIDEQQTERQFRFVMPGPTLSVDECERCVDEAVGFLPYRGYFVASGSLPPGVPSAFYRHVGERVQSNGGLFVLDTSGAALRAIGLGTVFLLKASRTELGELLARQIRNEREQNDAAKEAVSLGYAEFVVLSLGAGGAVLASRTGCWRFAAATVPVASTVGAGDSMVAGILRLLSAGGSIQESVRYGVAAGAAALMRPGTELCRVEDTDRIFAEIRQPTPLP